MRMNPGPADPPFAHISLPRSAADWQVFSSGSAQLKLQTTPEGLQLDYDFPANGGFVVARCALDWVLDEHFDGCLELSGQGLCNRLELKLVAADGRSVWRWQQSAWSPASAVPIHLDQDDFVFAWGPASASAPQRLSAVELALVAEAGGQGRLQLRQLAFCNRPPLNPIWQRVSTTLALQRDPPADDGAVLLEADLGELRSVGGLYLRRRYRCAQSAPRLWLAGDDLQFVQTDRPWVREGEHWALRLGGARYRSFRLECTDDLLPDSVQLWPQRDGRDLQSFWTRLARQLPRGRLPRWLYGEQCPWTPVGIGAEPAETGWHPALLDGDGVVEVDEQGFSVLPLLRIGGRWICAQDVVVEPALAEHWQPFPRLRWIWSGGSLQIDAEVSASALTRVHYQLEQQSPAADAELVLLIRPFQLTSRWQSADASGGLAPIHRLRFAEGRLWLDDVAVVYTANDARGSAQAAQDFDLLERIERGETLPTAPVDDASGQASALLRFHCQPVAEQRFTVWLPNAARRAQRLERPDPAEARFDWSAALPGRRAWRAQGPGAEAVRVANSAVAQILATRNGPVLQPGPRRYARAWIRDATVMAMALNRMGRVDASCAFVDWYAPWIGADGAVPCGVSRSGIDPLIEHDSHGQWLSLLADCMRYGAPLTWVEQQLPAAERTLAYLQRCVEADGLLPVSVSHEGYLAQPVHAYWDDVWALRGLDDFAWLCARLERPRWAQRARALHQQIHHGLIADLARCRTRHQLSYLPGSREWADLDPTASVAAPILLAPWPETADTAIDPALPEALQATLDAHLRSFRERRSERADWANYSPYEIRIIGALVRSGRRDDALEMLGAMLDERFPVGWNQWPEIVWRDRLAPAHLGDLPHTWIAAEYLLALRSMIVYEHRASAPRLIVAAGVGRDWLLAEGLCLQALATDFGPLSLRLWLDDDQQLHCALDAEAPTVVELRPPLGQGARLVAIDTLHGPPALLLGPTAVELPAGPGHWRLLEVRATPQ